MSSKKATPGRRRLFQEDDRIRVSQPNKDARTAIVAQYDTAARKLLVHYDNEKQIDKNWISTKHVDRIDAKGNVIPRPTPAKSTDRSTSRGRSKSPTKKTSKKSTVSSRTRSKSRERMVTAEFSADDSAANEPQAVTAKKSPKKRKTQSTPKRAASKIKKDAEFSADDEDENLSAAAEKASREPSAAPALVSLCLNTCCNLAKTLFKLSYFYVTFFLNLMHVTFVLFLKNVPMILTFCASIYFFFFLVDKKNVRYQSLWPLKFPSIPSNKLSSWSWLGMASWEFAAWKKNFFAVWSVVQFPLFFSCALHFITYLKEQVFPAYKITIGAKPRVSTMVNLKKVWMTLTALTALVLYMDKLTPYFDKLCPVANPITPVIRSYFMLCHGYLYDGLCCVFRNTGKFYFYLLVLALFKSYDDFDFDFDLDWKTWFMNPADTTSLTTRFLCTFGSDMFLQTAFFVLAARNPSNVYLWVVFNSRFIQNYLSYRAETEETSVRRHYTGTNLSGWYFYSTQIFKTFAFTNIWRFVSKIERVTSCKYGIAAFAGLQLLSFILSFSANRDYPSEKRNGIHGKIRHADRLADICALAAMTALCEFSFGNAPYVVLGLYVIVQVVDICWQEEAQKTKSKTKWESYFNKVPFKLIPKVY